MPPRRVDSWLLAETVALLFVPAVMLVCAFPTIVVGLLQACFPAQGGVRLDLLFGLSPFPAAACGLWSAWRCARCLARGQPFRIDGWLVLAAVAGGFATWEIATTTGMLFVLLTCAPPAVLAVHLAVLRWQMDVRDRRAPAKALR